MTIYRGSPSLKVPDCVLQLRTSTSRARTYSLTIHPHRQHLCPVLPPTPTNPSILSSVCTRTHARTHAHMFARTICVRAHRLPRPRMTCASAIDTRSRSSCLLPLILLFHPLAWPVSRRPPAGHGQCVRLTSSPTPAISSSHLSWYVHTKNT